MKNNMDRFISIAGSQIQKAQKIFEGIGSFLVKMADSLSAYSINFPKFYETINDISYIELLGRLKLPIFFINNGELKEQINKCCEKNDNKEEATTLAIKYCDLTFINSLKNKWENISFIKKERINILCEALSLHNEKRFYASTSIMMCQIYGIGAEILNIANEKGLQVDNETYLLMQEYFGSKPKSQNNPKVRSEKWNLVSMTTLTDSGYLIWNKIAEYLANDILVSGKVTEQQMQTQPLRNKICHGEQLNFNTEEHSLKAVLLIDILIELAYCIYNAKDI